MENKSTTKKIGIGIILIMSVVSFIVSITTVHAANLKNKEKLDIRFVVDASYVMNQADPNKTRIRALQKVIKSIPEDSRAGVWTYGKYVNMLIPVANVDNSWKKQAIFKIDTIGGYGDYRNLGEAIDKAAYGWQSKSDYNKYIVVITNGDYRISKSKIKNASAQLALLTKTLAKLKKANIELHAVSLSKNSDNRLLKILAKQTNGNWYQVSSINSLYSVMNHVYSVVASNHDNKKYVAQNMLKDMKNINQQSDVITNATEEVSTSNKWSKLKNKIKQEKIVTAAVKTHQTKQVNNKKLNTKYKAKPTKKKSVEISDEKNTKSVDYNKRKVMDFNWPSA